MANVIQIKRSNVTTIPVSLAEGELAYSEVNGVKTLYIGTNGGTNIEKIGGKLYTDKLDLVTDTELDYLAGVTSDIQTQLDGKATDGHSHNISEVTGLQGELDGKAPLLNPTFTGTVTLPGDPTQALHAATKQYVDNIATGLDVKQSVRVGTTANITLSGLLTIDGVVLTGGDRVLVKNQTDPAQNGIYSVSSGVWTRSTDADNTPSGEVTSGMYTFIEQGTQAGAGFILTTANPIVLGTTQLTFTQFNSSSVYTAGTGIDVTGSVISIANHSAGFITSGTMSGDRVSGGTFGAVNGSALTNLNASNLASGTVPDARLSGNVLLNSSTIDGGTF